MISIELLKEGIEIKNKVVTADPFEKGERKKLNFGHTFGHVIEGFYLGRKGLSHGWAVAIGMIFESYLSYKKGNFLGPHPEGGTAGGGVGGGGGGRWSVGQVLVTKLGTTRPGTHAKIGTGIGRKTVSETIENDVKCSQVRCKDNNMLWKADFQQAMIIDRRFAKNHMLPS